ncbi:gem-associated protein 6-like [Chelonus insularis]|uniref:gem-associated protein 6-like n=1 Tax=Chelonus insularis TaxID=460826 RepID=UPI0015892EE8|nr:gem-associated protein 6-like [Chelonus insularis]
MSDSDTTDNIHRVFKNDPLLFKSYLNKFVTVTTNNLNVYNGFVYTVDPVSESIVLFESCGDNEFKAKIIMGHCIKIIEITSEQTLNLPTINLPNKKMTEAQLAVKREAIKKKLTENCLPVIDEGDGIIEIKGMVFIEPPYELENCFCDNPIILNRINNILYANRER